MKRGWTWPQINHHNKMRTFCLATGLGNGQSDRLMKERVLFDVICPQTKSILWENNELTPLGDIELWKKSRKPIWGNFFGFHARPHIFFNLTILGRWKFIFYFQLICMLIFLFFSWHNNERILIEFSRVFFISSFSDVENITIVHFRLNSNLNSQQPSTDLNHKEPSFSPFLFFFLAKRRVILLIGTFLERVVSGYSLFVQKFVWY